MIEESLLKSNYIGKDGFIWWLGQVAPREVWWAQANTAMPDKWGARCKVRIVGYHPFDGGILADEDLPWAQIMMDPSVGSFQGGIGETPHLRGGESVFGFFLDGDDGQQPVIAGVLYRSEGVKNIMIPEVIQKEKSSRFKPFTGHPNKVVKPTQRNTRAIRDVPIGDTPTFSSVQGTIPNSVETSPYTIDFQTAIDTETLVPFDSNVGFANTDAFNAYQPGDKVAGVFCYTPAASTSQLEKKADITLTLSNGCNNNLIGRITQALQDFMAITNGLDRYLNFYIDPILNVFADIQNIIASTARQIGGIVRLILNNLRDTIFKTISKAFRQLVGQVVPPPQQTIVMEASKSILDIIFCMLEKLPFNIISYIEGLLEDLVDKYINAPLCAVEQWTASILAQLMSSIDDMLSNILSGISWLTGGLGSVYGILNQANSLASQIYSFLECTGQECKEPSVWASKFGLQNQSSDNWNNMVSNVNIFDDISTQLEGTEEAMSQLPMYGNNIAFSSCNEKVYNPTNQSDLMPLKSGTRWSRCIPPEVRIIGDGIGASAVAIVGDSSSIFSVEVLNGGTGYTQSKTSVNIIDNSGYGKNARANVIIGENGEIQSIYLTSGGTGYCKGNYSETLTSTGITTSYNLSINQEFVYEGDSFTATLITQNIPNGTKVPYSITGVSSDRIDVNLNGHFIVENNIGTLKVNTLKNSTLGDDGLLKISAATSSDYLLIKSQISSSAEYVLSSSKNSVQRGESFNITLKTSNIKDETRVPYTITGIGSSDIFNNLRGYFVINSNSSSIELSTLKYNNADVKLLNLSLDNKKANISVRINSYKEAPTGISTFVFGCLDEFIITSPGYGYTTGDKVTDGTNTWSIIVSPVSGAVVGVQPLSKPICGLTNAPSVYINSNTGVGAEVVALMRYTPANNVLLQEQQRLTGLSGIAVTSVVDCI